MPESVVVYRPHVLRSMAEICVEMGVSEQKVMDWKSLGAPIAVEGTEKRARYSAEMAALQKWRVDNSQ